VFSKAQVINTLGNRAVHRHPAAPEADAPAAVAKQTAEQLRALEAGLAERDEKLAALLADKNALDDELKRLRAEVAEARKAAAAEIDTHDYSEAETRDYFIDLLLKEAGWLLDQPRDREFEVAGMPNVKSAGFVDYVLWGDDGQPLAVVEAKRTRRDGRAGQQQAKLYADCLEQQFGQRPVIFYSNGYDHWLWDDTRYPPRRVQGFYKKAELELLIQRRQSRRPLGQAPVNAAIVERHYQTRAIRRIAEAFERDRDRKALLVMATGAGKTRTVIALADLLMRCNWAKRVLFLADRVALVIQAVNAFKRHLPDASPVNLVTDKDGVPTDAYGLEEAVRDGCLVPAPAVSVPLRFQREGITYDEFSEDDEDQWDALEWDDDGVVPDRVGAEAVNKWLFNKDTVDKVLEHLMTRGLEVAGGDRLGKTIVFAKNQHHAEFIAERFDANYPHYKGEFALVITFKTEYAQSLIDSFSSREKAPHIAISVDMLDTGIDVPEVVNLVFFKLVRSKTKFWQMLGRGTRLCPDLFGPGQDKESFFLFDYCQNLEYLSQDIPATEGSAVDSLAKRLFNVRLELIAALDGSREALAQVVREPAAIYGDPKTNEEVRQSVAELLQREVAAMNFDNFVVRPHRRLVEKYARPEAWAALAAEALSDLSHEVAGLPAELDPESEEAKRFDLLALGLRRALLRCEPGFERLRDRVQQIAHLLEEKDAIPMVREQMALIQDVQTDEWWQDVTVPMLEVMRRRLRGLVQLIDKRQRKPVFTDFEDLWGGETGFELPGFALGAGRARFLAKARAFLRRRLDHVAIEKLRKNKPLTATDLSELERMLAESGVGDAEEIRRAAAESHGLGLFVRSLVGLDREAAKEAMASFISGKLLSANQLEFINLVTDDLTEHGVMEPARLYESPFTDLTPRGPDALFKAAELDELMRILDGVRATAAA